MPFIHSYVTPVEQTYANTYTGETQVAGILMHTYKGAVSLLVCGETCPLSSPDQSSAR